MGPRKALPERLGRRDIFIVTALLLGTVGALTAFALAPRDGEAVAVFGSPLDTGGAARVVGDAGGSLVAVGGLAGAVIARGDDAQFVSRLYASGAWLVLDGRAAPWCRTPVLSSREGNA